MENSLGRSLTVAGAMVQYNDRVKNVLANKQILAWILQSTMTEFEGCSIEEVEMCIEGTPKISKVSVNPGESNANRKIVGCDTVDEVPEEGKVIYDIRFVVYVPQRDEKIKILVNVEAQKKFHPGYQMVTRGIFYGGRMLSAQLDTEFSIPQYDNIKKVYSIWICMNAPEYIGNAISTYSMKKEDLVPGIPDMKSAYDKMTVVLITLNDKKESDTALLGMLNTLLSPKKKLKEKKRELEEKYQLKMREELEKEEQIMCNVAEAIYEDGLEQGVEHKLRDVVQKMYSKGISEEAIAEMLEEPLEEIRRILSE